MTIAHNVGRQEVVSASVDIDLTTAALVSGTAQDAIQLPPGAFVVGGQVDTITAFNSATSDVAAIVLGTETLLAAGDISALGSIALTKGSAIKTTANTEVTFKWTGAGAAPTVGTVRLTVEYVRADRAEFTQG